MMQPSSKTAAMVGGLVGGLLLFSLGWIYVFGGWGAVIGEWKPELVLPVSSPAKTEVAKLHANDRLMQILADQFGWSSELGAAQQNFDEVRTLMIEHVAGVSLAGIGALRNLEELIIVGSSLIDLDELINARSLQMLHIVHSDLADSDLVFMSGLRQLEMVDLSSNPRLTRTDFVWALPKLRCLQMNHTGIRSLATPRVGASAVLQSGFTFSILDTPAGDALLDEYGSNARSLGKERAMEFILVQRDIFLIYQVDQSDQWGRCN